MKGLVSVITPCYNTGAYISRLLNSVLEQTYPKVEMIAVDDGSTDNTADIIRRFIPMFAKRGYSLTYIYQKNSGQAAAIQNALDKIHGEFLVWPDSDDYYASPKALEKMVEELNAHDKEFAIVRSQANLLADSCSGSLEIKGTRGNNAIKHEERTMFDDCVFIKGGFYFCSGAYMIRWNEFKKVSETPIFTARGAGQNWQMLLPLFYHYRCVSILAPLFNIVERQESHSRGEIAEYSKLQERCNIYERTLLDTLQKIKGLPTFELARYKYQVKVKYASERLYRAFSYNQRNDVKLYTLQLKELSALTAGKKIRIALFHIQYYRAMKVLNSIFKKFSC